MEREGKYFCWVCVMGNKATIHLVKCFIYWIYLIGLVIQYLSTKTIFIYIKFWANPVSRLYRFYDIYPVETSPVETSAGETEALKRQVKVTSVEMNSQSCKSAHFTISSAGTHNKKQLLENITDIPEKREM